MSCESTQEKALCSQCASIDFNGIVQSGSEAFATLPIEIKLDIETQACPCCRFLSEIVNGCGPTITKVCRLHASISGVLLTMGVNQYYRGEMALVALESRGIVGSQSRLLEWETAIRQS
jgi:hypothetical protein